MSEIKKTVLALGYFDGAHAGHRAVISAAKDLAIKLNAALTVFTFHGNLRLAVGKGGFLTDKRLLTDAEREKIYVSLGADKTYFAPTTAGYLKKGARAFLNDLNRKFNVAAYVCGEDYTFGKNAAAGVADLIKYAAAKGQTVLAVKTLYACGEKVSSSAIKKLLYAGEIEKANALLEYPYFITGEVTRGRGVGKKLGFPTANLTYPADKCEVKEGVYAGKIIICGTEYKAVINYGAKPTFGDGEKSVEAHAIDFSGDLYGKTVRVCFEKRLRDIKKFASAAELSEQLEKDVAEANK